jgi:hypothetical protein
MTARFEDHILGPDTHANLPAAASTPKRALYECTTHSKIYYNDGSAWQDWATLAGAAIIPAGGTSGQVLAKNSGTDYDTHWVAASGGGSGTGYPPGSADIPPVSPNAKDDEFDGTSTVTWTSTPTAPNAWDINTTRAHHAYLKASGSGAALVGKYQAVPASYPYTITAKVTSTGRSNYHRTGGIFVAAASPTGSSNAVYLGGEFSTSMQSGRILQTLGGTYTSQTIGYLINHFAPLYMKMKVNSATSIDMWVSVDGYSWMRVETAYNPGFTPGVMGMICNEESAGGGVEAFYDFFRIT